MKLALYFYGSIRLRERRTSQDIQFEKRNKTMNTSRIAIQALARQSTSSLTRRPLSISSRALFKAETDHVTPQQTSPQRQHDNADEYRKTQTDRPLNPHMTNTNSAIHNEKGQPSVGADNPPPEFLSKVDPNYIPKDRHPENTERMTGGTQPGDPDKVSQSSSASPGEWGVGEMEGAQFRIEPLRRTGEDTPTMRARLLCSYFLCLAFSSYANERLYRPKQEARDIRV